jgi:hypothetical protein
MRSLQTVSILPLLFLLTMSSAAYGQRVDRLPEIDTRPRLILFLDDSPASAQLESAFQTRPDLASIVDRTRFETWKKNDPQFAARWSSAIRDLPGVMLQLDSGGYVFLQTGDNLAPVDQLFQQLQTSWIAYRNAAKQQLPQDCPDGRCPTPDSQPAIDPSKPLDFEVEPAGRRLLPQIFPDLSQRVGGPIRDTLAAAVWVVVLFVLGCALILFGFAILIVVLFLVIRSRSNRWN